MPACSRVLRSLARQQGRLLRFHHGGVAPIRQNSQWAGSWTGVLTASDFPSQTLRVPLPAMIQESGRLLFTFHDVAGLPITGATSYGYPASASHPRAREATNNLLASVTRQLVYGRQGPRFVAGDFNHHPHELSEIQQWISEGWVEVQSFAARLWGQPIVPTCKGATQRDLIYISPELAAMCSQVSTFQCFAEHDTVVASFVLPRATIMQRTWPLPAQIPCEAVDFGTRFVPVAALGMALLLGGLPGAPSYRAARPSCSRSYSILDVDQQTCEVALEEPIDTRGHSTWAVDGEPCQVQNVDGFLCVISGISPSAGQELEQRQILTAATHIHQEFVDLWIERWQKHALVDSSTWQRVMDFSSAFLPACSFDLAPIGFSERRTALKRYKAHAARGADGFAKMDLLSMPRHMTEHLLDFLRQIEDGQREWPAQMLVGLIMSLDKQNSKHGPDAFRPICVLSLVYRTWSGIRARQILKKLSACVDGGALGFLPERETKELWFSVQAASSPPPSIERT